MNDDAAASLRSIRSRVRSGAETLIEYSPAGSAVSPAMKSKGILTTNKSCACATRVEAIAVSAIMAAITKARVFMGHSFFLFAGDVQAELLAAWFLYRSAPQHGVDFRRFPGGAQCTGCEPQGDCG